jgi:hypothetical protein
MGKVNRRAEVLLVGDEAIHAFIERILRYASGAVRIRCIHIGMDAVHTLGFGRSRIDAVTAEGGT